MTAKAICPHCGRKIRVDAAGFFVMHRPSSLGQNVSRYSVRCDGSLSRPLVAQAGGQS